MLLGRVPVPVSRYSTLYPFAVYKLQGQVNVIDCKLDSKGKSVHSFNRYILDTVCFTACIITTHGMTTWTTILHSTR
jgi:hypothetical protein